MAERVTRCRTCQAEVYFVVNVKSGRPIPLNPFPCPEGNVVIEEDGRGRVLTKEERATTDRPLYLSHFATCQQAEQWRSKR